MCNTVMEHAVTFCELFVNISLVCKLLPCVYYLHCMESRRGESLVKIYHVKDVIHKQRKVVCRLWRLGDIYDFWP